MQTVQYALNSAKTVLSGKPTQAQVDNAYSDLNTAMALAENTMKFGG